MSMDKEGACVLDLRPAIDRIQTPKRHEDGPHTANLGRRRIRPSTAKGRVDDLQVGANRLVDIEAAVERLKQEALPELDAELSTLAQQQWEPL
jgi:hypothetical protein